MKVFKHYIIKRFNIKSKSWVTDKNGKAINDTVWLNKRYKLFNDFCLPSMKAQTEKDYTWLVFFDVQTPDFFKAINRQIAQDFIQFKPIYVKGFDDFEDTVKKIVTEEADTDFILTTRFDNDDCFHVNAIKRIQSAFVPKHNHIIELTKGLTLQIENEFKLAKRENLHSGPFITLIEDLTTNQPIVTVYNCEHTKWKNIAKFIDINDDYYWLQTIHNSNMANKLYPNLTFNKRLLKDFKFNATINFKISYITFVLLKKIGVFKLIHFFEA